MKEIQKFENIKPEPNDNGKRLDIFLSLSLPDLSRNKIKKLILNGNVSCQNLIITDPNYNVSNDEIYNIVIPEAEPTKLKPQQIPIEILYEDKDLLVVNKQAGLVVHPAPGNYENTLVNALIAHSGSSLSGIGGVKRPGIVHRLDKDTSGLLLVAKNDFSHSELSKQFITKTISRTYFGITWGLFKSQSGEIKNFIGRDPYNRKKMAVVSPTKGKEAITKYTVSKNYGVLATELFFTLLTGRTHQIRVHFSSNKHPLIGDKIYTNSYNFDRKIDLEIKKENIINRQALHAIKLDFHHPRSNKKMTFETDLPNDIKRLRNYFSNKVKL